MLNFLLVATVFQIPQAADPKVAGEPCIQGPDLRFEARLLAVSPNEGCAVGDIDDDGDLDITAGTHWFAAPEFTPRLLRDVPEFSGGAYLSNNGEHLLDVDGDGWLDVVSGGFMDLELCWYRNPGQPRLERGNRWERKVLGKVGTHNEITTLHDVDGDGTPEIFVNSWNDHAGVVVWRLVRAEGEEPTIEPFVLGERGHGHGFGWGDLDGDGDEDLLVKVGWYERPAGDPFAGPWKLRRDGNLGQASCPILIHDFDGDAKAEMVVGQGHGYGIDRLVRTGVGDGWSPVWERRSIDKSFSQAHALLLVDLLGEGRPGFVTGKRVRAHNGGDPGADDPTCLFYFRWDSEAGHFVRHRISWDWGIGTGLQIRAAHLNADDRLDLVVSGKTGTWVLTRVVRPPQPASGPRPVPPPPPRIPIRKTASETSPRPGTALGLEPIDPRVAVLRQRIELAEERLALAERGIAEAKSLYEAGRSIMGYHAAGRDRFERADELLVLRMRLAELDPDGRSGDPAQLHRERAQLADAEIARLEKVYEFELSLYETDRRSSSQVALAKDRILALRDHRLSLTIDPPQER